MVEMKVNPGELAAGGRGLEEAAGLIPAPPEPFTSTGADALSTILAALTQEKEAPLIAGLPVTKADSLATAQKIQTAAGMYERSDQQIATDVQNASARLDGAGGTGGAGSTGGASQMQQMMSMPMQVAQQAGQMVGQVAKSVGQLPQGIMQGVQGGVQQIGQMTGGAGQSADGVDGRDPDEKTDDDKRKELAPEDGAAAGKDNAERAPESRAVPDAAAPRHAKSPDPGIVL